MDETLPSRPERALRPDHLELVLYFPLCHRLGENAEKLVQSLKQVTNGE